MNVLKPTGQGERRKMKRKAIVAVVLTVAVCATVVWSQGPPGGRAPGGPMGPGGPGGPGGPMMACPAMAVMPPPSMMFEREAKTLQLTHDQLAKIKKALSKNEQAMKSLRKASADTTKALRTALTAPTYNAAAVKALAVKAEKAEASIVNANIDTWTQIRDVLSKTQTAKLQKAMSARRPGPFGPPPPPQGQ